jgi:hypothetical protein
MHSPLRKMHWLHDGCVPRYGKCVLCTANAFCTKGNAFSARRMHPALREMLSLRGGCIPRYGKCFLCAADAFRSGENALSTRRMRSALGRMPSLRDGCILRWRECVLFFSRHGGCVSSVGIGHGMVSKEDGGGTGPLESKGPANLHLNPVRAGIISSVEAPYTGHSIIMGAREYPVQDAGAVLERFSAKASKARTEYEKFVVAGLLRGPGKNCVVER